MSVRNTAPAPIQITAEQLLRLAKNQGIEDVTKAPKQFITDKEELIQYQQTKRKDFEDQIRRGRQNIGIWCRYALWEAAQKEFERARSIFERALDVDYRNQTLWLKYADMEMKNKFINHARNIWDRAVTLLPRVDNFWYKYSYMEEMIEAIDNARAVFERWMAWEPDDMGWAAFIKFEMRQGQIERARALYERYITQLPTARAYLKYAHWEEKNRERGLARAVYERALVELHPHERTEKLLVNFARFEERCKEFDRARVVYQYAMSQIAENSTHADEEISELRKEYVAFEKRHGDKQSIDDVIIGRRREKYEEILAGDAYDYDTWFDYIRLEEGQASGTGGEKGEGTSEEGGDRVRAVYERAIANVPPVAEKRYWRRYIYLWINYALFEELRPGGDPQRVREVYQRCLAVIPHRVFTFGKIWLMAAQYEVRQRDLVAARKILGQGIGLCGKENIFKGYIELELQLGEVDRCRTLYSKYIERMPFNHNAWKSFAQLETNVGESSRARAIYELAVSQSDLDMPELLWKAYVEMEIGEGEYERARNLYKRLLSKSSHVKVWLSYAQYEAEVALPAGASTMETVRGVFTSGYDSLKWQELKEERVVLLEAWRNTESARLSQLQQQLLESGGGGGDPSVDEAVVREEIADHQRQLRVIEGKMPKKIKMKRPVNSEDPSSGFEEYFDYAFPDDEKKIVGLKILERAMAWKTAAATTSSTATGPSESVDDVGAANGGGTGDDTNSKKRKADDESIDIDSV